MDESPSTTLQNRKSKKYWNFRPPQQLEKLRMYKGGEVVNCIQIK